MSQAVLKLEHILVLSLLTFHWQVLHVNNIHFLFELDGEGMCEDYYYGNEKCELINTYILFLFAIHPAGFYKFLTSNLLLTPFSSPQLLMLYLFRVYCAKQLAK